MTRSAHTIKELWLAAMQGEGRSPYTRAGCECSTRSQQLRAGQAPDNYIDPATLTPLVRTYLRDAFRAVRRVQQGIKTSLKTGGQVA